MGKLSSLTEKVAKVGRFGTEFFRDMALYIRYCGISPMQDAQKRRFYKLLIECHALEKGLSLLNPRALFGKTKIDFLRKELDLYDLSQSPLPAEMILGTFEIYVDRHRERGVSDPYLDEVAAYAAKKRSTLAVTPHGGLRHFERGYKDITAMAPADFIASRFSSRTFSDKKLERAQVEKAVALAQQAPSQCNRQASHAYFYQDRDAIARLLKLQGGSSGFAQDVHNLFVITVDLAAWGGAQQRNQLYVDGALFSMTLIYALHATGIATCPLNLAVTNRTENDIRQAGDIPSDQRLIMMIAVGEPARLTAVDAACSPRRKTTEILHFEKA
ncbi:nitroreductase family protein [Gemmobacter sp. 24YEA27]|uniref:nitroreductase family protein n=1 Tax=Gemmobacter sp. 24YEA27 TaxID=3040672 RepID=UPI0024B33210|nr:nitroreductase family protein [Gemmobacter sp. 24YEA27]